jgi:hypothetical protein
MAIVKINITAPAIARFNGVATKVVHIRTLGARGPDGIQGPKGDKGEKGDPGEGLSEVTEIIWNSTPSGFKYKMTMNDDGTLSVDPYIP